MAQPPTEMARDSRAISVRQIRALLSVILPLPRAWVGTVALLVLISLFDITHVRGRTTVEVRATTLTAALLAAMWLPALLRVVALAGGGLKTPVGEAQTSGLLELLRSLAPDAQREALPSVIAALDSAEARTVEGQSEAAGAFRVTLEQQLASLAPSTAAAREQLERLAREYERLRRESTSGSERTFEMDRLVAEARSLARAARYGDEDMATLMSSDAEGDRLVGLAAIQALEAPSYFDFALDAIANSRSAFEQYHGLRAVESMVDRLDRRQRRRLREVLEDQKKKWITPADPDRWLLAERLLAEIGRA